MNIEDARRIKKMVIEHDAREGEIKRIDNCLKHMLTDEISICIKRNATYVIDEFKVSQDEIGAVLTDMKNRREFLNNEVEKELDRYAIEYGGKKYGY